MLISIGIVAFLAIFLASGPGNDALILSVEKYVKKEIVEKERKSLLLDEIKSIKDLQKAYQKETKGNVKKLNALILQHKTDKEKFVALYQSLEEYERTINDTFFDHRIIIQETLTQEEWDGALATMQKEVNKDDKSGEKSLKGLKKDLTDMKDKILKVLNEDFRREKAETSLDKFIMTLHDFGEKIIMYDQSEENVLLMKSASKSELDELGNATIDQWLIVLNAYTDLHQALGDLATEDEWKTIGKALTKI